MTALTRTLLERNTVREELRQTAIGAALLTDDELDASRRAALSRLSKNEPLWVFGYGSLVWNPQIDFQRAQRTRIFGLRRALCLWSRINRGTPETPGLVFGLMPGGSCTGIAYEIAPEKIASETVLLWRREMLMANYLPVWAKGKISATGAAISVLTFRVNPDGAGFAGDVSNERMIEVLQSAKGRFGTCSDYVLNTLTALEQHGIHDKCLARVCKTLAQAQAKNEK